MGRPARQTPLVGPKQLSARLSYQTSSIQVDRQFRDILTSFKVEMLLAVIIILALTSTIVPLPIPQGGTDADNAIKPEITIDTTTHKVYTYDEFLTPSNHGEGGAGPLTDIVCLITSPISDIVAIVAGLRAFPCSTLYNNGNQL